jgi:hypothetical protein
MESHHQEYEMIRLFFASQKEQVIEKIEIQSPDFVNESFANLPQLWTHHHQQYQDYQYL